MSGSSAIGKAGESVRNLLKGEMNLSQSVEVTLLAPDESSGKPRINLFLYKVQESPYTRNMDWQVSTDPTRLNAPPLTLNLFYIMTPYANNDADTGNTNAHVILGEAMRVLHQFPIIPDAYLDSTLQGAREQLKVIPANMDTEELSKIWSTFSKPYRLSVIYEVAIVQLDQIGAGRDIATRVSELGIPQVTAPYTLPEITTISPQSGSAGSVVTVSGKGLDGWKAYVTISGRNILDAAIITGNSFDVALPADIQAGFHQISIDISHLNRRTFFFEVTP